VGAVPKNLKVSKFERGGPGTVGDAIGASKGQFGRRGFDEQMFGAK
jgi:hypothetical protein